VRLVGTKSNRDGIGAVVKATSGGETQTLMMRSGSSYLSASELVLTFGLGQRSAVDRLEIKWPSGQIDQLTNVAAGQTLTVKEAGGIVAARPYSKGRN
jgi:hypothetical protein